MEFDRLAIKFFATEPVQDIRALVPVFHSWIQKQCIDGHLLIDVHDYSHIHNGPGILLVGHEGNFCTDMAQGRHGLLYGRKQPLKGSDDERFEAILGSAIQGCRLLEKETGMRFRMSELLVVANDRLRAPNDGTTFAQLEPVISRTLKRVLGSANPKVTHQSANPKERFAIHVA